MNKLNTYIVPPLSEPIRLLDFVIQFVNEIPTRNGAKKAIKKGNIKLNGNTSMGGIFINQGDTIELYAEEPFVKKVFKLKLEILFEDEYLAVINKPAGISVSGNFFRTIQNALPFNITTSTEADKLATPQPVHRLDNPTSGLLIIAKTKQAQIKLGKMLENKTITKVYHALVLGEPKQKGEIKNSIDDKNAITRFEVIKSIQHKKLNTIALVKLWPLTGRTHQLRIHMAQTGHPILGDKQYGTNESNKLSKGLFLTATELQFNHPVKNKPQLISLALPNKFTQQLQQTSIL